MAEEERAPRDDDFVGMVGEVLVSDMVDDADLPALARDDPIPLGGGQARAEQRGLARSAIAVLRSHVTPFPQRLSDAVNEPTVARRLVPDRGMAAHERARMMSDGMGYRFLASGLAVFALMLVAAAWPVLFRR